MSEEWRDIRGYEGLYQVSNFGRVKSLKRIDNINHTHHEKILKYDPSSGGYYRVTLCKEGKTERRLVYQLVLETFIGPRPEGYVCCHNDGNRHNDTLKNLRWDTKENNELDKIKHGTIMKGSKNGNSKLTEDEVIIIRFMAKNRDILGYKLIDIQKRYGISRTNLRDILQRRLWKHI